jgi:hypothetical protein
MKRSIKVLKEFSGIRFAACIRHWGMPMAQYHRFVRYHDGRLIQAVKTVVCCWFSRSTGPMISVTFSISNTWKSLAWYNETRWWNRSWITLCWNQHDTLRTAVLIISDHLCPGTPQLYCTFSARTVSPSQFARVVLERLPSVQAGMGLNWWIHMRLWRRKPKKKVQ